MIRRRSRQLFVQTCAAVLVCSSSERTRSVPFVSAKSSAPDLSSTALRMHNLYIRQPPHDTALYDILQVSPNATSTTIAKSYRKLSRQLHPDKQRHARDITDQDNEQLLDRVRKAYDVLKDDRTRLSYHRHGLFDARDAVSVLTGNSGSRVGDDAQQSVAIRELLWLMGYGDDGIAASSTAQGSQRDQRQRSARIAANLVEWFRPVVEETLPEHALMDHVMEQCDRLKGLPLGAQIIRCVGRAYRYTGHQWLLREGNPRRRRRLAKAAVAKLHSRVSVSWRTAKHFGTAAAAAGRVALEERRAAPKNRAPRSPFLSLPSSKRRDDSSELAFGEPPNNNYDDNEAWGNAMSGLEYKELVDADRFSQSLEDDENELRESARFKAHEAVLESVQVEALWKICKIDLDRIIRKACESVLDTEYFFYPSDYRQRPRFPRNEDGWVGSNGMAVTAKLGKERFASLLITVGDIMVRSSKQNTAWME